MQQSSDGKIRFVCPTSGLVPSTATHISAQQWSDRIDWAAGAAHYSIYGSYDDNNDNIHWGITNTANNSAPEMRYPEDDPYYYYNVLKDKLSSGPEVFFVKPADNEIFGPEDIIHVEVNASDDDSISSVDLYINQTLVGTDSTAPYQWGPGDSLLTKLTKGSYTLAAVANDMKGISTKASVKIAVEYAAGISNYSSETNQNLISVYPNPSDDILNIRCTELELESAELEIYDASGVRVMSRQISGKQSALPIDHLARGMYLLKIVYQDQMYLNKFLKN